MKKLILSLGGAVVLLLIAATAYVITFDPNENKDWIAAKFREATGRELTLGGEADLTLFPWLGLTLNDVAISNGTDFSNEPMLRADHAQVRVKLLGLLSDEYEIDTVRLHGLALRLERLGNGRANWEELSGEEAQDEPAGANGGSGLDNLILGGVDIQNATVIYDDQLAGTHYEIRNLNMAIGELVYGEPLEVTMSLEALSRAPELGATLNLDGTVVYDVDNGVYDLSPLALTATLRGPDVPNGSADLVLNTALNVNLDDDTLTLRDLRLDALDMQLAANVSASRMQTDTPAVVADLDVNGEDLAVLFRILDQDELAQRISTHGGNFSITAKLDADMVSGVVNVPALQARILGADINGNLSAARVQSEEPAVKGTLNASGPDLPTLVELTGMLQGGSDSALSQYGRELSRVPDKTFRVQTDFDADMQSGNLAVPELYASLFGATINGSVTGTRINTDTPQLRGQLNAQGPDLPLLMMIAGQLQGGAASALNQYGQRLRSGVSNRAFTLSTDFDADLQQGNIQLPTLNAALLGFRLNGNLDARNMKGNDGDVNGALRLEGENLSEVLAAIGQAGLAEVARALTLDMQVSGGTEALRISPLNLSLVVAGPQLGNSPQTLALDADTVMNLDDDSLRIDDFTLSGLGLDLSGNVSASQVSGDNLAFNGRLDLPTFNARRLLQQLNLEVPETADPAVLQAVALTAIFEGNANSLALNDIALTLDDTQLTGSVNLSDFTTQAMVFTLNVDRIDADRYLAPPAEAAGAATAEESPLPLDTLRTLTAQGALNVGQLTLSGLRMNDILVQLNAAGGDVALDPIRASLYEGSFQGNILLNAREDSLAATVNTTLGGIQLGPLLQDFMDSTYLTGTGNVSLALNGSGTDSGTLKRSLNGSGSLALENGILRGVDVDEVLRTIETMIRSRRVQALPEGGETQFENFSATLAIQSGVVRSDDLLVEAPGWKVAGRGTLVNLNDDTIDYDLITSVVETPATTDEEYDLGGYTLPIACTGNVSGPRCLPDAQQIITAAVGNAVQERLGEFLQDRFGTGTQQQAPATNEATDAEQEQPAPEPQQEEADPGEELLNRALDRLLR